MAEDSDSGFSRRRYVQLAAGAGIAGLAGCSGSSNTSGSANGSANASSGTNNSSASGSGSASGSETLEIQHWWTGGDGHDAIEALFNGFKKKYPEVDIQANPVSGGAGANLKSVIKKRILNGNPPSTWQAHPGKHLIPFTDAGKLKDIEQSVWSHNDMKSAYNDGVKQVAKPAGNYVAVPLDIHRLNNLFYNPKILSNAGVSVGDIAKPSDLVDAMKTVESKTSKKGMIQATSGTFTTLELWETVLIGEHGLDTYQSFYEGNGSDVKSEITDALSIVKEYSKLWNDDSDSLSWTEANNHFIQGEGAFYMQGDWAAGMYYSSDSFQYETDWNQVTFPGTENMYTLVIDSFPMPTNNPSPDATKKFLRYCGSVEGQKLFNPKKGSIPPRTDVPKDPFTPFSQSQMKDFENSKHQPPSTAHGLATSPSTLSALDTATANFTSNWNVDATASAYISAFSN